MKYTATRTKPDGTSYSVECKNIRAAGELIYFWLMDNGYQHRPEARTTAYQAEQDGGYTGYGSTWTITPAGRNKKPDATTVQDDGPTVPAPRVQVTPDGPAYLLPGIEPAPHKRGEVTQTSMF